MDHMEEILGGERWGGECRGSVLSIRVTGWRRSNTTTVINARCKIGHTAWF